MIFMENRSDDLQMLHCSKPGHYVLTDFLSLKVPIFQRRDSLQIDLSFPLLSKTFSGSRTIEFSHWFITLREKKLSCFLHIFHSSMKLTPTESLQFLGEWLGHKWSRHWQNEPGLTLVPRAVVKLLSTTLLNAHVNLDLRRVSW